MPRTNGVDMAQDEGELGPAAGASALSYMPWQTLSALAVETGQNVRHTFGQSEVNTSGHVQQSLQHHVARPGDQPRDHSAETVDSASVSDAQRRAQPTSVSGRVDAEAVRSEIGRVQRKMMSTDAAKEVILRFNFMGARESKVGRFHCLHVFTKVI